MKSLQLDSKKYFENCRSIFEGNKRHEAVDLAADKMRRLESHEAIGAMVVSTYVKVNDVFQDNEVKDQINNTGELEKNNTEFLVCFKCQNINTTEISTPEPNEDMNRKGTNPEMDTNARLSSSDFDRFYERFGIPFIDY